MKNNPNKEELIELFKTKPNKKSKEEPSQLKISNLKELEKFVERLKPGANEKDSTIIIDTKGTSLSSKEFSGKLSVPQSGGQSNLRQTILEGFEMIKNHHEFYRASIAAKEIEEEFGGYPPATAPNPDEYSTWIDRFIKHNLGAHREGLTIVWDLPEGSFKLDPWSCTLSKIDVT